MSSTACRGRCAPPRIYQGMAHTSPREAGSPSRRSGSCRVLERSRKLGKDFTKLLFRSAKSARATAFRATLRSCCPRRSSWPRLRNPRNRGIFRLSRPQPDIPQPSNQMSRNAGVFSERRNRDTGERRIYFVAEITSGRPKGRVMYQKLRSTVSIGRPKICTSSYWCHQVFVKFRPRAAIGLRNRRSLSVILGIDG